MLNNEKRIQKFTFILIGYPIALVIIALALNQFVFGVEPLRVALPSNDVLAALIISSILLLINHSWLMTTTELTRLNYKMYASQEEWIEAGVTKEDVSSEGWIELDRRHNAHRNATENSIYFGLLAVLICFVSPSILAAQIWIVGFAIGRLGYTYSALRGLSGQRGIFMTISLLSLYGLGGYLGLSLID